jgi:hypothetical protein
MSADVTWTTVGGPLAAAVLTRLLARRIALVIG